MTDHFIMSELKEGMALLALLAVIEKLQYRTQEERILMSEALAMPLIESNIAWAPLWNDPTGVGPQRCFVSLRMPPAQVGIASERRADGLGPALTLGGPEPHGGNAGRFSSLYGVTVTLIRMVRVNAPPRQLSPRCAYMKESLPTNPDRDW